MDRRRVHDLVQYPYSQQQSLAPPCRTRPTARRRTRLDQINYIRNSVKATVDAYSGKVTLYAWDTQDPVLKAWQNVFPATVKPMTDMSGDLMATCGTRRTSSRCSATCSAATTCRRHVLVPDATNSWRPPPTPRARRTRSCSRPYYLTMQMPDQDNPTFSLYSTYIPNANTANARSNLTGYLAVDADAGSTPGHQGPRLRQAAAARAAANDARAGSRSGAEPVQHRSDGSRRSEPAEAGRQHGGRLSGNLLTLPVGGGLLYVQPVYVQSTRARPPTRVLQKVLAGVRRTRSRSRTRSTRP